MTTDQVVARLTVSLADDLVTVEVVGEIDRSNAAAFGDAVRDLGTDRQVVLDLTGVTFLGSAGLRAIAASAATCLQGGEPMTVRNPPHLIRRLLRVARLDEVVHLEPEVDAVPATIPVPETDELRLVPDPSAAQLASALRARTVVAQAEGVLMARHGIGADAAAGDIRRCAAARGVTVAEHAATILTTAVERPADSRIDR